MKLDSESTLKGEPARGPHLLQVECKRKTGDGDDAEVWGQSDWKNGVSIQ